jgi:hypothetical protein
MLRAGECYADYRSWRALFRSGLRGRLRPRHYSHAVGRPPGRPPRGWEKAELMEMHQLVVVVGLELT